MYYQVQQQVAGNNGNGNGGPPPASGRACYRGGAREPRPGMAGGEGARAPTEEMAALGIGEQRPRGSRYVEPRTRPEHVTEKTGEITW